MTARAVVPRRGNPSAYAPPPRTPTMGLKVGATYENTMNPDQLYLEKDPSVVRLTFLDPGGRLQAWSLPWAGGEGLDVRLELRLGLEGVLRAAGCTLVASELVTQFTTTL